MRVPLSWLQDFVDIELTPEQLAERLTLLGMEVSNIEQIGSDWHRVVVGELLEVGPHPNSGKLSMTRVRVGHGEPDLAIVCGATNIEVGQRIPVALPGSVLSGDRHIEVTTIAGAESQGMLCSGDELGLTSDADGILILPPQSPLGVDLVDFAGDVVLDIDVKPNRGDALSILGLAREVAAATGAPLRWPDLAVEESGDHSVDHIAVRIDEPGLCPRFVGRFIEGVDIGPSPWHVQKRLIAAGMRPISNVVDTSNYVLMELGKPVHIFDASAVRDGRLQVRLAQQGERLQTLDHVDRALAPDTLLIADESGPLAIAGVMGGAASEVSDSTRDVIIESAIFDALSIRRTAFRYSLRSEASLRFEKGQEHALARAGADRTAALMVRWAGGRAALGVIDTQPQGPAPVRIPFRPARVSRLLGEAIPSAEQRELLARVEVATEAAVVGDAVPIISGEDALPLDAADLAEALVAIVPGHRRDLVIEADIAEEVARVRGYETLASRLPDTVMPPFRPDPRRLANDVRELLAGSGLAELVTHGLISPTDHAHLGFGSDDTTTIRAANPVTLEHSELRRSLLPGQLRVISDNERQRRATIAAFELGSVHRWRDGEATERDVLGLILSGDEHPVSPDRERHGADVATAKGLLERLAARLLWCRLEYAATDARDGVEHPGRTAAVAAVSSGGQRTWLGRVGELHPRLLEAFEVRSKHVAFAEIDLSIAASLASQRQRVGTIQHLPGADRDIALVVAENRAAGDVALVIREVGGPLLRDAQLFDVYRGSPLQTDQKSLAYRLRFETTGEVLEDREVESAVERMVAELSARLGARLRA
ncbi:MAG: phenylalanine--tRNA ligase subunit beta [Chloroflexota bacterium]